LFDYYNSSSADIFVRYRRKVLSNHCQL